MCKHMDKLWRKLGPISATNEILENRRPLRNIPGLFFFHFLKIRFSLIYLTLHSPKLFYGKPAGGGYFFCSLNYTSYMGMFSRIKGKRFLFFTFPESRHPPCAKIENSKSEPNKIFMKLETIVSHREYRKRENMNSKVFLKSSLMLIPYFTYWT